MAEGFKSYRVCSGDRVQEFLLGLTASGLYRSRLVHGFRVVYRISGV